MTVAIIATALACLAASLGVYLAYCALRRRRPRRALALAHPVFALGALTVAYVVVTRWQGRRDLPLDAGTVVLTFAFLGGGLLFALRSTRLPRPAFVILLHGLAAVLGCVLLIIGLVHRPG